MAVAVAVAVAVVVAPAPPSDADVAPNVGGPRADKDKLHGQTTAYGRLPALCFEKCGQGVEA